MKYSSFWPKYTCSVMAVAMNILISEGVGEFRRHFYWQQWFCNLHPSTTVFAVGEKFLL